MPLRIAVQMDPIDSINIAGDSTFALMLAAQERGHSLFEYPVENLTLLADDSLVTHGWPVSVRDKKGDHFTRDTPRRLDLGQEADVILMRQDPPFHMGYITATHMLERIGEKTLIINDPANVRNAPEKVMVLDYRQFMPPTLVTRSVAEVRRFMDEHGAVVVKPIHGNGGKAIFRVPETGDNLTALFEVFNQTWPEPHMVQPFLPEVAKGDKRIILIDGEFAGAINRIPGKGEFRSNLAMGGSAEATRLTAREEAICEALGPELKKRGLVFVGIDVIGGEWLTEINVTSPTGIVAAGKFEGRDLAGMIWDAIERRHAAMPKAG